jgi:hypothetical protein
MIKVLILLLALVATVKCFECLSCPEESIQCAADTCDDGVTCTRIESSCFGCQELYCGEPVVCTAVEPCSTADCDGDCTTIPQTAKTCASFFCEPLACVSCFLEPEDTCEKKTCDTGSTCELISIDDCKTCPVATCVKDPENCVSCFIPEEKTCDNENLCATGETCEMTSGDCQTCPKAICVKEPETCVSCSLPEEETCDNENLCATGETCEYTGGDCQTCPVAICIAEPEPPIIIECDECLVQASCDKVHCEYGSTCKVTPHSCNGCSSAICVADGCFTPKKSYFEDCTTSKKAPHETTAPTAAYSPAPTDYSTKAVDAEYADAQQVTSSGHNGQMIKRVGLLAVALVVVFVVV